MKYDNFDKENYKLLKRNAKIEGVYTTSLGIPVIAGHQTFNGVSIAFMPMTENGNLNGRMLAVAISYCAPEDKYRKKVGKYNALLKLERGECIQLPLAPYLRDYGKDATSELLLDMFAYL